MTTNETDTKCRYMEAAYPTLPVEDCCGNEQHRHEQRVFDLATAIAARVHEQAPTDEQVGWFLGDADAVVDDFDPAPEAWEVTPFLVPGYDDELGESDLPGIDFVFTINGQPYVVQKSEWEPAHPVARATWESWHAAEAGA